MVPIARTFATILRAYGGSLSHNVTLINSSCSQLIDQEWMLSKALDDLAEQIIRSAFWPHVHQFHSSSQLVNREISLCERPARAC